jgi:hypothetical protein
LWAVRLLWKANSISDMGCRISETVILMFLVELI